VANLANFNATHGAIGGVVVLLWFYVSSFAIPVGAELNGVIEQAWRTSDGGRRTPPGLLYRATPLVDAISSNPQSPDTAVSGRPASKTPR
jgi:membrane protein